MYTAFASVYDRLMADVDYQGWARFYHSLMERYGKKRFYFFFPDMSLRDADRLMNHAHKRWENA